MPLMRTRGIGAAVGAEVLFEEVDLALEAGERVCVTGRNGAGKSHVPLHPRRPPGARRGPDRTAGRGSGSPSCRRCFRPVSADPRARWVRGRIRGRPGGGALGARMAGRPCPQGSRNRRGRRFRVALGRLPAAAVDRPRPGGGARSPPPRRADQPPRRPRHRGAGAAGRGIRRRPRVHDPRSRVPRTARDPDRGDRPGAGHLLAGGTTRTSFAGATSAGRPKRREGARFDRRLASEESWLRGGLKARRIRNMGRLRRLVEMRKERRARRVRPDSSGPRLALAEGERSGRRVIEAGDVAFGHAGTPVVAGFSCLVERGRPGGDRRTERHRKDHPGPSADRRPRALARPDPARYGPADRLLRPGTGAAPGRRDGQGCGGGRRGSSSPYTGSRSTCWAISRTSCSPRGARAGPGPGPVRGRAQPAAPRPAVRTAVEPSTARARRADQRSRSRDPRRARRTARGVRRHAAPGQPRPGVSRQPRDLPVRPRRGRAGCGSTPGAIPTGSPGRGPPSRRTAPKRAARRRRRSRASASRAGRRRLRPSPPRRISFSERRELEALPERNSRPSKAASRHCTRSSPTPRSTGSRRRSSPVRAGSSARPRRSSKARSERWSDLERRAGEREGRERGGRGRRADV